MRQTHQAAILQQKGERLTIQQRATPEPGPNDILIQVKAIALNPVDYHQRDVGFPPLPVYPAVIGNDVSGIVAKAGSQVSDAPEVGSRVLAFASSFFQDGNPDYGAFQDYVLAQSEAVIKIPDTLTFEEAAAFPLGLMTALTAWTTNGISLDTKYSPEDRQAVLIWGGASSVGTFAIQSAKLLGFTVYATASPKNHDYRKTLGAHAVFDYKAPDVVSQIIQAVERDNVLLHNAHCVVKDCLLPTLDILNAILNATKGDATVRVALSSAPPSEYPKLDNTTVKFNFPSTDAAIRDQHIYQCFHGWLKEKFSQGSVVPSPSIQIEDCGLEGLNAALDKLRDGVSGAKIVVPLK